MEILKEWRAVRIAIEMNQLKKKIAVLYVSMALLLMVLKMCVALSLIQNVVLTKVTYRINLKKVTKTDSNHVETKFTPKWWDYKPEQCYKNSEDKWVCGPRDAPECRNLYRQFLGFTDDEDGEPKNINTDEKLCKRIGGIWGGKIEGKSSIMFPVDYIACDPVCVDKEGTWNSETRTYTCDHTESTCNQDKITGSGGIYLRNILNSCSKWSCSFANKNEDLNDDSASDSNKTGRLCDTRRNLEGDAPTFSDTSDDSCCLCAFGYKVIGTGTGAGVNTTKMLEEYENSLGNEFDDDIDELMNVDYEDLTLAQQAEWNKNLRSSLFMLQRN